MSGCITWPYANGLYVVDLTLEDCGNRGRPRYRQVSGNGTIWSNGHDWIGSTILCSDSLATRQFDNVVLTYDTPDKSLLGDWDVTKLDRSGILIDEQPEMTVSAVPLVECCKY